MGLRGIAAALCAVFVMAGAGSASAAVPVPGFKEENVVNGGLSLALALDWTPDGRMVIAEKAGRVLVRNPNGTLVPVLDLRAKVNSFGDRGLTGIAVDINYATNNYVYLLYTYDAYNPDANTPKTSRLTRIVLRPDNTVANASLNPETVLLGTWPTTPFDEACPASTTNAQDCIPADGVSHVAGTVRQAPDGTLFVGSGDARDNAQNNPSTIRPLDQKSLAGKILRVDRNGRGVAGHPFCPTVTDLTQNCTKVFALGFRNPFRFDMATRGGLWAGDVGASRAEEFDHVVGGGSYGWPCWEGPFQQPGFTTHPTCQSRYASGVDLLPAWWYEHTGNGAAIIGGPEYRGSAYPPSFKGSVFVGEFVGGTLDRVVLDSAGKVVEVHRFADDWVGADLRVGPDGYLYTAAFHKITRIVPASGNRPPRAAATVSPHAGLAPLEAHFDAAGSSDPDGDALTYTWTFGDGTGASGLTAVHSYGTNGRYTAKLTVTDPGGLSDSVDLEIVVGTRAPDVEITSPAAGTRYRAGVPVALTATATDPEDGDLPDTAVTWRVTLVHNQHEHPLGTFTGKSAQFEPLRSHDSDSHYLIDVTAVDADGVATTKSLRIDPRTIRLELATDPPLQVELVYGGMNHAAPFVHDAGVGHETAIGAPATAKAADGKTLVFAGWSDGNAAATRSLNIPDQDLRLVARYRQDSTPPDTVIDSAPGATTRNATPSFYFHSTETRQDFQCRVDAGAWFWCMSPFKSWKLSLGRHTFEVRAYDTANNVDPTPAKAEFLVIA